MSRRAPERVSAAAWMDPGPASGGTRSSGGVRSSGGGEPANGSAETRPAPGRFVRLDPTAEGSRAAMQVSLSRDVAGLRLLARIDRLDSADRERLIEEATALLREHGLGAIAIRINGHDAAMRPVRGRTR